MILACLCWSVCAESTKREYSHEIHWWALPADSSPGSAGRKTCSSSCLCNRMYPPALFYFQAFSSLSCTPTPAKLHGRARPLHLNHLWPSLVVNIDRVPVILWTGSTAEVPWNPRTPSCLLLAPEQSSPVKRMKLQCGREKRVRFNHYFIILV